MESDFAKVSRGTKIFLSHQKTRQKIETNRQGKNQQQNIN